MRVDLVLWLVLAALLSGCGLLTLRACDLGLTPLFGGRYCAVAAQGDALAIERARARDLEERVREAELRIAEKPACAPPQQPEKRREPTPPPTVPPIPPEQPLTVPKKISELKGCWESVRGDLDMVTDDEKQLPVGKVRKCYCFGARGFGEFKMSYSDGVKCRTPITAELDGELLKVHQPKFGCGRKGSVVRTEIVCHGAAGEDEAASCEYENLGRIHTKGVEQYRRVPLGHCG